MSNDKHFLEIVEKAVDLIKPVGKPTLPRKQKKSNYSALQYVTGYKEPESNDYHPETVHNYFESMYFQALDAIINTINDRFEQPALKKFINVEELLLKSINKADSSKELKALEPDFYRDFDRNQLESELHLISAILKQSSPVKFAKF